MRYAVRHNGQVYQHTSAAIAGLHAQQLADDTGDAAVVLEYRNGRWCNICRITSCNVVRDDENNLVRQYPMAYSQDGGQLAYDPIGRDTDPADACGLVDELQRTRHRNRISAFDL